MIQFCLILIELFLIGKLPHMKLERNQGSQRTYKNLYIQKHLILLNMNSEYTVYTQPCGASFISANKIKFSIWWDIFISANKAPIDKMSVFGAIAQSKHGGIGNYPAPARSAKI